MRQARSIASRDARQQLAENRLHRRSHSAGNHFSENLFCRRYDPRDRMPASRRPSPQPTNVAVCAKFSGPHTRDRRWYYPKNRATIIHSGAATVIIYRCGEVKMAFLCILIYFALGFQLITAAFAILDDIVLCCLVWCGQSAVNGILPVKASSLRLP